MVILPSIFALLNQRKKRILQVAEAALPEGQFRAFRSLVLDELGREGFERDVERLVELNSMNRLAGARAVG